MAVGVAARDTFVLNLASVAPLRELEDWFANAAPGESAQYASGIDLPRNEESVRWANRMQSRGLAKLSSKPERHSKERWCWIITKAPLEDALPKQEADTAQRVNPTRSQCEQLLTHLRTCADIGQECPSYRAMASHLDLPENARGRERARYLVQRLEADGAIKVTAGSSKRSLVVMICAPGVAQGQSTKSSISEGCA